MVHARACQIQPRCRIRGLNHSDELREQYQGRTITVDAWLLHAIMARLRSVDQDLRWGETLDYLQEVIFTPLIQLLDEIHDEVKSEPDKKKAYREAARRMGPDTSGPEMG